MRTLIALIAATLAGCATQQAVTAAPQNYRLAGESDPIEITGRGDYKLIKGAFSDKNDSSITILFNGEPIIHGKLDQQLSGEFSGSTYKGRPTGASCNSKQISLQVVETRCMVFIGNERTVTLTF